MANSPKQQALTLRILWGALLSTLLVYTGITFIIPRPQDFAPMESAQLLQLVFAGLSVGTIPVILILRQIIFWKPLERGEVKPDTLMPRFFSVSILTWAMCESIAIYGLTLYMITYERPVSLAFIGASALAMLAFAPIKLPEPRAGATW